MPLIKDIDIALAEYMYEEFIVKGVQHTYKDVAAVLSKRLESIEEESAASFMDIDDGDLPF